MEMTDNIDGEEYFWPKIFKELDMASFDEATAVVLHRDAVRESVVRIQSRRDTITGVS